MVVVEVIQYWHRFSECVSKLVAEEASDASNQFLPYKMVLKK